MLVSSSLKKANAKSAVIIYPKLNKGYATLTLTLDSTLSQISKLEAYKTTPMNTNLFVKT